ERDQHLRLWILVLGIIQNPCPSGLLFHENALETCASRAFCLPCAYHFPTVWLPIPYRFYTFSVPSPHLWLTFWLPILYHFLTISLSFGYQFLTPGVRNR